MDGARECLGFLAELTGGAAILCDAAGEVVAWTGDPRPREEIAAHAAALLARREGRAAAAWCGGEGVSAVIALPAGHLILDNRARRADAARYRRIVEESLPYIAQVAGGDAVMFDGEGARVRAHHPDGKANPSAIGEITELCRKAMLEGRASIGTSVMIPGALAVRIPMSPDFGVAFNNKLAAVQRSRLIERASQQRHARYHLEDILGDSPAIARARKLAADVARSPSTVLISGETGTGKELFAQAIHTLSDRAGKPFVAINCGALPRSLIEGVLFGHVEGAFTGARRQGAPGVFEQADGGTLLLDEIGEMPFDLQVSLLRVIQEREVRRLGAEKARAVDVRILASTNASLEDLVRQGRFRSDLYYRLNVLELTVPPLRERREDIPALAYHFINRFARLIGKEANDIEPAVMAALAAHGWPGNVRELQNCVEHMVNMLDGNTIRLAHLPGYILGEAGEAAGGLSPYAAHMLRAERDLIVRALREHGPNKAEVARRLGLNRTTLWRILRRLGLDDAA